MNGEKIKGISYAEVKAKALRHKDVLAAYEKAKREDDPHAANALRLFMSLRRALLVKDGKVTWESEEKQSAPKAFYHRLRPPA